MVDAWTTASNMDESLVKSNHRSRSFSDGQERANPFTPSHSHPPPSYLPFTPIPFTPPHSHLPYTPIPFALSHSHRLMKRTTAILGAATASSTVQRSLRRCPFCSFVCSCVGLFWSCMSARDLFSFNTIPFTLSHSQTVYNTKSTRAHTHRELI